MTVRLEQIFDDVHDLIFAGSGDGGDSKLHLHHRVNTGHVQCGSLRSGGSDPGLGEQMERVKSAADIFVVF